MFLRRFYRLAQNNFFRALTLSFSLNIIFFFSTNIYATQSWKYDICFSPGDKKITLCKVPPSQRQKAELSFTLDTQNPTDINKKIAQENKGLENPYILFFKHQTKVLSFYSQKTRKKAFSCTQEGDICIDYLHPLSQHSFQTLGDITFEKGVFFQPAKLSLKARNVYFSKGLKMHLSDALHIDLLSNNTSSKLSFGEGAECLFDQDFVCCFSKAHIQNNARLVSKGTFFFQESHNRSNPDQEKKSKIINKGSLCGERLHVKSGGNFLNEGLLSFQGASYINGNLDVLNRGEFLNESATLFLTSFKNENLFLTEKDASFEVKKNLENNHSKLICGGNLNVKSQNFLGKQDEIISKGHCLEIKAYKSTFNTSKIHSQKKLSLMVGLLEAQKADFVSEEGDFYLKTYNAKTSQTNISASKNIFVEILEKKSVLDVKSAFLFSGGSVTSLEGSIQFKSQGSLTGAKHKKEPFYVRSRKSLQMTCEKSLNLNFTQIESGKNVRFQSPFIILNKVKCMCPLTLLTCLRLSKKKGLKFEKNLFQGDVTIAIPFDSDFVIETDLQTSGDLTFSSQDKVSFDSQRSFSSDSSYCSKKCKNSLRLLSSLKSKGNIIYKTPFHRILIEPPEKFNVYSYSNTPTTILTEKELKVKAVSFDLKLGGITCHHAFISTRKGTHIGRLTTSPLSETLVAFCSNLEASATSGYGNNVRNLKAEEGTVRVLAPLLGGLSHFAANGSFLYAGQDVFIKGPFQNRGHLKVQKDFVLDSKNEALNEGGSLEIGGNALLKGNACAFINCPKVTKIHFSYGASPDYMGGFQQVISEPGHVHIEGILKTTIPFLNKASELHAAFLENPNLYQEETIVTGLMQGHLKGNASKRSMIYQTSQSMLKDFTASRFFRFLDSYNQESSKYVVQFFKKEQENYTALKKDFLPSLSVGHRLDFTKDPYSSLALKGSVQTSFLFVNIEGGNIEFGRPLPLTDLRKVFLKRPRGPSVEFLSAYFSHPYTYKKSSREESSYRTIPRFESAYSPIFRYLPPAFVVQKTGDQKYKIFPSNPKIRFHHPQLEIESLPRLFHKRLGRGYLSSQSPDSLSAYFALRKNTVDLVATKKRLIRGPHEAQDQHLLSFSYSKGIPNIKAPCLIYREAQMPDGEIIYNPVCLFPEDLEDWQRFDPRGYVRADKLFIKTIPKFLEAETQLFLKSTDSSYKSQKFLEKNSPSKISKNHNKTSRAKDTLGNVSLYGVLKSKESLVLAWGNITQKGEFSSEGLSLLLSLDGAFESVRNSDLVHWRHGSTHGYFSDLGPKPETKSVKGQLAIIAKKGILTQGAHLEGATRLYLKTNGALLALPVSLYTYWKQTWHNGERTSHTRTEAQSTFSSPQGSTLFEGQTATLVNVDISAHDWSIILGAEETKVLPGLFTHQKSSFEQNKKRRWYGSTTTRITSEAFCHSRPLPSTIKAQKGTYTGSPEGVTTLVAPQIFSPKNYVVGMVQNLLAAAQHKESAWSRSTSDFFKNSYESSHTSATTYLYPHIEGAFLTNTPGALLHVDVPASGRLPWQRTYQENLLILRQRLEAAQKKGSLTLLQEKALVNLPHVLETILHDHYESHFESHTELGPGLMLGLNIVLGVVTMGALSPLQTTLQTAMTGTMGTTAAAGMSTMIQGSLAAGLTSVTGKAIQYGGDLDRALQETFSREGLKNIAVQGLTAGLLKGVEVKMFGDKAGVSPGRKGVSSSSGTKTPVSLSAFKATNTPLSLGVKLPNAGWASADFLKHTAFKAGIQTVISGVAYGHSPEELLKQGLQTFAATYVTANLSHEIGQFYKLEKLSAEMARKMRGEDVFEAADGTLYKRPVGSFLLHKALHFGSGLIHGLVRGGDPIIVGLSTALSEVVGDLSEMGGLLDREDPHFEKKVHTLSKLVTAYATHGMGGDHESLSSALEASELATEHNLLMPLLFTVSTLYSAYDVIETYQAEGPEAAAQKLILDGLMARTPGGAFKVGSKLFSTAKKAVQAFINQTPLLSKIVRQTHMVVQARKRHLQDFMEKVRKGSTKEGASPLDLKTKTPSPASKEVPSRQNPSSLPDLPAGYHYKNRGGKTLVARNPGASFKNPKLTLEKGKVVEKPRPVKKPRTPHGNSLECQEPTHVYAIFDPKGNVHKIGESMQGYNSLGQSIRGEKQVRDLIKKSGQRYVSRVRKEFPNKKAAKQAETTMIQKFRGMHGPDTLPGNKTNH